MLQSENNGGWISINVTSYPVRPSGSSFNVNSNIISHVSVICGRVASLDLTNPELLKSFAIVNQLVVPLSKKKQQQTIKPLMEV